MKKTINNFLTIVISLTLSFHSLAQDMQVNNSMESEKAACEEQEFKTWDSTRNLCVMQDNQKSFESRKQYDECAAKEDEAERKSCMEALAKSETSDVDFEKAEKGGFGKSIPHAAITGLTVLNWSAQEKGLDSLCTSAKILGATAAAGFVAENYFKKFASDKMKDLEKSFKSDQEQDPYSTQILAFDYLKKEQETVSEIADMRNKAYLLLTIGYGIATAMAVYDLASQNHKCSATAGGDISPFTKFMATPSGIAILGGIGTGYSLTLANAAGAQKDDADNNAKEVEKIKKKLMTNLSGFCPEGHDDIQNSRCYCYLSDNSKNTDHSNSETCQSLWASDDNFLYKTTSGKVATGPSTKPGCISVDGKFDQNCKCKKYKNEAGANACLKTTVGSTTSNFSLPNLSVSDYESDLNDLFQGNTTLADLSTADLAAKAAIANKIKTKAIQEINNKRKLANQKPLNFESKAVKNLEDSLVTAGNSSPFSGSDISTKGAIRNNPALSKAISEAKKKTGLQPKYSSKQDSKKATKKAKNQFFSFDDSSSSSSNLGGFKEEGAKKYDYKNNDIHMRKDVSIWKVISNRYMQTGLKRLFPDDQY